MTNYLLPISPIYPKPDPSDCRRRGEMIMEAYKMKKTPGKVTDEPKNNNQHQQQKERLEEKIASHEP